MQTVNPHWMIRLGDLLRTLGNRPSALLALMLALNSLAMPYAGFVHDARLYGVQVFNRLDNESFADDLFFRYGSQDQYSLFSRLAAPLAGWAGLPLTFFLLYLASNILFLWSLKRLVEAIIDDRSLSTIVLVAMSVMPLGYGGYAIFHVQEPFLTPRIVANAGVLFGLERMLRGRPILALVFLMLAGLLHPIMALGGAGVWAAWVVWRYLPRRALGVSTGLAVTLAVAIIGSPPLAGALFGQMDNEWLRQVRIAATYNFPAEWAGGDWLQLGLSLVVLILPAFALRGVRRDVAALAIISAFTAIGGQMATMVASERGYALLFQAQPYRALWIARCLQPILGVMAARELWQQGTQPGRLGALALVATLGITTFLPIELLFPLFFLPFLALIHRGIDRLPRDPDWLVRSLAGSLVLGAVGWTTYRLWLLIHFRGLVLEHTDPFRYGMLFIANLGPVVWTVLTLAILVAITRRRSLPTGLAPAAIAAALVVQLFVFAVPRTDAFRRHCQRHHDDICFVADFLAARHAPGAPRPTVYWSIGAIDVMWFDLGVNCYYERLQIQGVMFSRLTAVEGRRRALLVRQFEVERLARERDMIGDDWQELLEELYQMPLDAAQPAPADLHRLCQDPACDYVIVPHGYAGQYAATNGRYFIYDCKQLRATAAAHCVPAQPANVALASNQDRSPIPLVREDD